MSTLSCSRWIFLLSLAALMLVSPSAGGPFLAPPCWEACIVPRKQNILTCFEQKPRHDCATHGFLVEIQRGKTICIKGHTRWIKKKISDGDLHCPSYISDPL